MSLLVSLKRKESLWLLTAIAVILLLSSIPYLVGYQLETDTKVFGGAFFNRQDVAVHMASIQAGRQGDWLYHFRFTSEDHQGYPVKMFYVLLGQFGRIIPTSVPTLFHLARLLGGLLALGVIYLLVAEFFQEPRWRRFAFLLVVFGAGLGWLQIITGWIPTEQISPIDYWYIDPYILFGLMILPHFSFITAGIAAILLLYFRYQKSSNIYFLIAIIVIAFLLQIINPLSPLLADIAIGVLWLTTVWRDRKVAWREPIILVLIGVLQVPLVLYNLQILTSDPSWSQFFLQNATLSPPLVYFFYGFAPFWFFALIGLWQSIRRRDPAQLSLAAWLIIAFLLSYLPISVQRRFLHALMIPAGILSVFGMRASLHYLEQRIGANWFVKRGGIWAIAFFTFASLSTLTISLGYTAVLATYPDELYESTSLSQVSEWMIENLDEGAVVFCSHSNCQYLAAYAGVIVFTGHPIETLRYEEKKSEVEDFFSGNIHVDEQFSWLWERNIDYVLYDSSESNSNDQSNFTTSFPLVFEASEIALYKVSP